MGALNGACSPNESASSTNDKSFFYGMLLLELGEEFSGVGFFLSLQLVKHSKLSPYHLPSSPTYLPRGSMSGHGAVVGIV